jgi:hypothetical protein
LVARLFEAIAAHLSGLFTFLTLTYFDINPLSLKPFPSYLRLARYWAIAKGVFFPSEPDVFWRLRRNLSGEIRSS